MDRQSPDKGFTLIEMLLVLMLVILMISLFPFTRGTHTAMSLQMEQLRQQLLWIQGTAMREGKEITVTFDHQKLYFDTMHWELNMTCSGKVIFHPNGNVDHARTLTCTKNGQRADLVIQLGSGRMYVKK